MADYRLNLPGKLKNLTGINNGENGKSLRYGKRIPGQFSTRQKSTDISLPTFFHIPNFYQTIFHQTNFHQGGHFSTKTFPYQDIFRDTLDCWGVSPALKSHSHPCWGGSLALESHCFACWGVSLALESHSYPCWSSSLAL